MRLKVKDNFGKIITKLKNKSSQLMRFHKKSKRSKSLSIFNNTILIIY